MHEILFRSKRLDNRAWIYGDLRQDKDLESAYISGWSDYAGESGAERGPFEHAIDPATVGEYTGLTDKTGAKIFEGDICKSSLGLLFTVEWDEENARFIGFTIERERRLVYLGREPKVEIVGSIHDNPELLDKEES